MELKFNVSNIEKALYKSLSKKPTEREDKFFGEVMQVVKMLNKHLAEKHKRRVWY